MKVLYSPFHILFLLKKRKFKKCKKVESLVMAQNVSRVGRRRHLKSAQIQKNRKPIVGITDDMNSLANLQVLVYTPITRHNRLGPLNNEHLFFMVLEA